MVESERVDNPKKGKKGCRCSHIKMKVLDGLDADTFEKAVDGNVSKDSTFVMDDLKGHAGVERVTAVSERQAVPGKEAPKILPWVHVAISNAKALFKDMYHGIKTKFLQEYLNESCYKFNHMHFNDRTFDRLMITSVSYTPTFKHRKYGSNANCG